MKYLILSILLFSQLSFAKGYRCRATCIILVPDEQSLTFLGSVKQEADETSENVYVATEEACQQRAARHGYDTSAALLVKHIQFSSWQRTHTIDEGDESGSSSNSYSQSVSGNWYHYRVDQSAASESSYSSHYYYEYDHQQSLEANPIFFRKKDCEFDKSIRRGTLTYYTGDRKFYP